MTYQYMVKFQLLLHNHKIDEICYCSKLEPCSKWRALLNLAVLWNKDYDYFQEASWRKGLESAVEAAKVYIQQAEDISHSDNTVYNKPFSYLNQIAEVRIVVAAGNGHFSHRKTTSLTAEIAGLPSEL